MMRVTLFASFVSLADRFDFHRSNRFANINRSRRKALCSPEQLEHRNLMASDLFPMASHLESISGPSDTGGPMLGRSSSVVVEHNFILPHDVDDDGAVTPLDALSVINQLNSRSVTPDSTALRFHDVDDDSVLTPLDALVLINDLNSKASNTTPTTLQGSTIRNATTGVRVRAEMEIEGTQSELKIRVDQAPTSTSFSVVLNEIALGQLVTDSRGRGQLVLGNGDDNETRLPLPQGLTTLSPQMELVIGDIVRGTLSQVAKVENENSTGANSVQRLSLVATFPVEGRVIRSAEYELEIENGVSKRKFEAEIEKANPNTSYDVSVAGVSVGNITTDAKGKGKLRLVSVPKDARENVIPATFPTVTSGTTVKIGTLTSTLL